MGGTLLGSSGVLYVAPASEGSVSINDSPYRGQYRLVPTGGAKFDVINDLNMDAYIAGVLPRELPAAWHQETYRAQAIVARTYALYERQMSRDRTWDVYPDDRSQMYGGVAAESAKSRDAAMFTSGIVVAYGPPGQERIFKAYFSSCCGGVTQSAADAFGDKYIEPLSDQNTKGLCNASPRFSWGPVVIKKDEMCRRFKLWGLHRGSPIKDLQGISDIQIQAQNVYGRPTRFQITDTHGTRYSLSGEEFRWAVNTDADHDLKGLDKQGQLTILWSSFVKVICDSDSIRFVEGHGWGHGVGMCQWCAERRAEAGGLHEDIVLAAYQRSKLMRAY
jgi:stage II sporulation protein D